MKLYHLSFSNLHGKTLQPRIPENFLTRNGYEDNKTKRVCFASSIDNALIAFSMALEGKELFVHIPKSKPTKIKKPSINEVPDSKITGEIWVMEDVELECVGKIKVTEWNGKEYTYKYGDNVAEMYGWKYKWINKRTGIFEFSLQLLIGNI